MNFYHLVEKTKFLIMNGTERISKYNKENA